VSIISFHSILTVIGVVAFIAMIFWVFSKKQKVNMDRHAMIPLQDDEPVDESKEKRERHG
jgi:cbb3-type cytochrome oxidase subunit 3